MSEHVDILDEREAPLGKPLLGSLALHVSIVLALTGFTWITTRNVKEWGSENAMGGAIGVDSVDKIPIMNRSVTPNKLANDTDASVPAKPEKVEKKKAIEEDEDAVPLTKAQRRKLREEAARVQRYETVREHPNQVYSPTGAGINDPTLYGKRGIGGIGIGDATIAGHGCGGYLELVRMRIQQRWDAQPISAGIRGLALVNLTLVRAGGVRDVSVTQSSGSSEVDFAARRAIGEAGPFPPFLPNCEGNEARIEVRFQPKR